MDCRVYQIYYDEATRARLDGAFIPLDNSANERPDWREYWPIRKFFLGYPPEDDVFYGFFSPRFGEKVGLSGARVREVLSSVPPTTDVVTFSGYWDVMAFNWNVIEHAHLWHRGAAESFYPFFESIYPGVDLRALPNHATNTVFCNFFVAKGRFWKRWNAVADLAYQLIESGQTPIARLLADETTYGKVAPLKVFLVERIVSVILAVERHWSTWAYDPYALNPSLLPTAKYSYQAVLCDSLKQGYAATGFDVYRAAFHHTRKLVQGLMAQEGSLPQAVPFPPPPGTRAP